MKKGFTIVAVFIALGGFTSCSETGKRIENADTVAEMATEDTAVLYRNDRAREQLSTDHPVDIERVGTWTETSFDREPVVNEPELRNTGVEARGNEKQAAYAMPQDILFDTDKAQLRPEAEEKLQNIAKVIKKRSQQADVDVHIYGHTDSRAGKPYNKELGKDRAQAVADWLANKGGLDRSNFNVKSFGQTEPEATNETAAGRQQNRRVEIVVRNK